KEWCSTASGTRRFIPGGGWNEASYMFTDLDAQPPLDRQPTYGFRCVKYITSPPEAAFHAIDQRARDFTQEQPVGDEIFDVIRRGRAVLLPIYQGTYERITAADTGPNASRDLTIAWSKELGRSVDYLETRRDIDGGRIAYYGFSLGAVLGPILTALEPRFKA